MKQKMLVACVLLAMMGSGCSKTKPPTETDGQAAYVSDQEQYVQSLQQEILIDDPDAMLDDLNESAGDNSVNAERVRLKAVEDLSLQRADDPSSASLSVDPTAPEKAATLPETATTQPE